MIINIALGIVLAVIILRLLPDILALGFALVIILISLTIAGFVVSWAIANGDTVLAWVIAILTFVSGIKLSRRIEQKTALNADEAGALTIFFIACGFTAFTAGAELLTKSAKNGFSSYLPLTVSLCILGIYLTFKITRRLRNQSTEKFIKER